MAQIPIIEDDPKTASAIGDGLRLDGYEAVAVTTGEEGVALCRATPFDAIVLDCMLPAHSGIDVLKSLRDDGIRTPVLLLTARATPLDNVIDVHIAHLRRKRTEDGELLLRRWPIPESKIRHPLPAPVAATLRFRDHTLEDDLPVRLMERPALAQSRCHSAHVPRSIWHAADVAADR